jgi:hypothetical protein
MKRFLLGAATTATLFALASFIPAPAPAPQTPGQIEKVVVHDGPTTYVWEMSGTEVAGLMVFSLESVPQSTDQAVLRRHFQVREWAKK